MFRRLISNLPFSPSLIDQVALYSKQLKRESRIRGIGLVFLGAAVAFQCLGLLLLPTPIPSRLETTTSVLGAHIDSPVHNQGSATTLTRSNEIQSANKNLFPQISSMHGLLVSFTFIGLVAYFYNRSRLLAKELTLVKTNITSNGGA